MGFVQARSLKPTALKRAQARPIRAGVAEVVVLEAGPEGPRMRALAQALRRRGFAVRVEAGASGPSPGLGGVAVMHHGAEVAMDAGAPVLRIAFTPAGEESGVFDLSQWRGGGDDQALSALVAALEERAPKAKGFAGRGVRRASLWAGLAMLVLAGSVGLALFLLSRPAPQDATQTAQMSAVGLREGTLSGAQAISLATDLAAAAFTQNRDGALATARAVFEDAAVQLVQDPDPAIRLAAAQSGDSATRAQSMDQMWGLAEKGSPAAPALYRAAGALMTASGDRRAVEALSRALRRNPQDSEVWRLLSEAQHRAGARKAGDVAALIARAIALVGANDRTGADAMFARALEMTDDRHARAFLLGQRGDYAAQTGDYRGASTFYAEAIELHVALEDIAALSIDSSKLARAWVVLGRLQAACAVLNRAKAAGAVLTAAEQAAACGP